MAGEAPMMVAGILRPLAVVLILVGLALPTAAVGAEPTSGYGSVPPKPETQTPEPPKPEPQKPEPAKPSIEPRSSKTGASPSKEVEKPELPQEGVGAVSNKKPAPARLSSLPFTGLDLRWMLGIGVVLVAAGGALMSAASRRA